MLSLRTLIFILFSWNADEQSIHGAPWFRRSCTGDGAGQQWADAPESTKTTQSDRSDLSILMGNTRWDPGHVQTLSVFFLFVF